MVDEEDHLLDLYQRSIEQAQQKRGKTPGLSEVEELVVRTAKLAETNIKGAAAVVAVADALANDPLGSDQ